MKIRKKEWKDVNVFDESLDRIRYLYDRFDQVVVSFSGGKDSTAVLNTALIVAKERNALPLKVAFFDEEAIHPPTIEYVQRVAENPDIDLEWYCLEFKHRNACSNESPFWYTWDKDCKDRWVRPMPEGAITEHPRFKKGMTFQEWGPLMYERNQGSVAMLTGVRTEESLRRYQAIATKKNDAYIQSASDHSNNQYRCHPIYDWSSKDVWLAVKKFGWDYNKTYDIFNQTSLHNNFLRQRVCPPFGEEPLRGLWVYAECFPEMWHKMLYRCDGVATAWRYANTELYSNARHKPEHLTYKEYLNVIIDTYDKDSQNQIKKMLNSYMGQHRNLTKQPIPDEVYHPVSGVSWKWLCKCAMRGDYKGRQSNYLKMNAVKRQEELGISKAEAKRIYG